MLDVEVLEYLLIFIFQVVGRVKEEEKDLIFFFKEVFLEVLFNIFIYIGQN